MEEYFLSLIRGEKQGFWPAFQRGGLWVLSWFYCLGTLAHNLRYDLGWKKTFTPSIPVISVGNLTVGGTGKTPCVEMIGRWFRQQDKRVVILSRGYRSENGGNDEALVLEENLPDVPHLQGKNRVELVKIAAEELESEIAVLDDGFQHRRLKRNLDVVLIDATNPWGFEFTLPRGLLREPLSSLKRADVVVLTRSDQVEQSALQQIKEKVAAKSGTTTVVETTHKPVELVNADGEVLPLTELSGKSIAGFCGIGNPDAFRRTLVGLGTEIAAFRTFPDHHLYTREDIESLRCWARQQAMECMVLTTQKDLVKIKLSRIGDRQLWALRIQLQITEGHDLLDRKLKEALE